MPPKRNTKKSIDDEAPDATPEPKNIIVVEKTIDNADIISVSDANVPIYPYVNKVLSTSVMIEPMQLNNKLEYHIKNNLKILHEGKIFKNYGYINKIHKVEAYTKQDIINLNNA